MIKNGFKCYAEAEAEEATEAIEEEIPGEISVEDLMNDCEQDSTDLEDEENELRSEQFNMPDLLDYKVFPPPRVFEE